MIISDNYLAKKSVLYKVRKSFLSLPREKFQCFWNNNYNDNNKILKVKQTSKQNLGGEQWMSSTLTLARLSILSPMTS